MVWSEVGTVTAKDRPVGSYEGIIAVVNSSKFGLRLQRFTASIPRRGLYLL